MADLNRLKEPPEFPDVDHMNRHENLFEETTKFSSTMAGYQHLLFENLLENH